MRMNNDFPCPKCDEQVKLFKTAMQYRVEQSIRVECVCGYRYTFYEIYAQVPQLSHVPWKSLAADGTEFQERYVPRKAEWVSTIIQQYLKQAKNA